MSADPVQSSKKGVLDDLIDTMPESELEEIQEKFKADEAKQKVLEKIELDKELQREIEKQASEKEAELEEIEGDLDGFHLFKEMYDLPEGEDMPDHTLDIESSEDKDELEK